MQTVVLAAGEGTRMRPLTSTRPKPMLPVAGKPLLARVLEAAAAAGAERFVLVVGYEADAVRDYFGDAYASVPIEYAIQEEQVGTAHAVRVARPHLEAAPFAVINGDGMYDTASLTDLYSGGPGLAAYEVDNPSAYGVLDIQDGAVQGVIEKPADPPSRMINAGAYVFPAAALELLDVEPSERGEEELTDVLAAVCTTHDVRAVDVDRWLDVGRPWELLEANEWQLETIERRLDGTVHESAVIEGSVVVEDGATVRNGVTIEGPALIQSGAEVGPGAYVRGATAIGPDVEIGHSVEVKNSVLMDDTHIAHLSYVGDSVIGRGVNFGAGTNVANLRHDDVPVSVMVKGERVSTGRRKFGVIVGDGAKTGINVSLNVGVSLPTDARIPPGETVLRDPDGAA
ncbi:MAG: bifunctional sugar-1-phosphate nucleotidylyltransferase/acetyltransferase [Halobacteriales archaeon]